MTISDVATPVLGWGSLVLPATQALRSTETLSGLDGDLTIECWFKWLPAMTSCTLEIGLQSSAKILIARDINSPTNDRFGISGTHGSFKAATGFVDWTAVGDEEAGLNEWRHLGVAIHSAGIVHDVASDHDVYSTGTVARLYLNGHQVGFPAELANIDLSGLKVHDASKITINVQGGGMAVDEYTVWRRDWSDNGANTAPFADGRGAMSGVINAFSY